MLYDQSSSTLLATPDEVDLVTSAIEKPDETLANEESLQVLTKARAVVGDAVVPELVRLLNVVEEPLRIASFEQISPIGGDLFTTSWNEAGDVGIMRSVEDEEVAVTLTHFSILPSLLAQELRLHQGADIGLRETEPEPQRLRASEIEKSVIGELDKALLPLDTAQYAWRVTGGFAETGIDSSILFIHAGTNGLWRVDPEGAVGEEDPEVTLHPTNIEELLDLVGDVVTGRTVPVAEELE